MTSLDLPAEIWHEIFRIACNDDGFTGRSLSLVSPKFRSLSQSFKFQSLVITQMNSLLNLLPILEKTPAELRRIKALCIAIPAVWSNAGSDEDSEYVGTETELEWGNWDSESEGYSYRMDHSSSVAESDWEDHPSDFEGA